MGIPFEKGDRIIFHGTINGKRRRVVKATALEAGRTSRVAKVRVMLDSGKKGRVSGRAIYMVKGMKEEKPRD